MSQTDNFEDILIVAPILKPKTDYLHYWMLARKDLYLQLGEVLPKPEDILTLLRLDADALARYVRKNSKDPIQCRGAGCNFCCRGDIGVSTLEVQDIAAKLTLDQVQAVRKDRLKRRTWVSKCPLLTESGSCGIYDNRPLSCRLHLNIRAPETCDTTDKPLAVQPEVSTMMLFHAVNLVYGVGEFISLLAAELEKPGKGAVEYTTRYGEQVPK